MHIETLLSHQLDKFFKLSEMLRVFIVSPPGEVSESKLHMPILNSVGSQKAFLPRLI